MHFRELRWYLGEETEALLRPRAKTERAPLVCWGVVCVPTSRLQPAGDRGSGERGSGQGVHLRPSPSPALPGAQCSQFLPPWGPQAASGPLLCGLQDVCSQARPPPVCSGLPTPPPRPRRQHAGLNTQGRMSRPGAPTDVLSPWAGGASPAGGPPNEAEGPQARVVAAAVWAEPVGCLALSHCRGFT